MKKSEFKKRLAECLESSSLASVANEDCVKFKKALDSTVEDLFITIEKCGMLPPTIKIPIFGVSDNSWESENE